MGKRGAAIDIGMLLVTFMTSGAAVAALNVMKAWIEKDEEISFKMKKADGTEIIFEAKNIDETSEIIQQLLKA